MLNSNKSIIFNILKSIDDSYENNNFSFESTFDLKTLNISEKKLNLILTNLINDGYIQGFSFEEPNSFLNSLRVIKDDSKKIQVSSVPCLTLKGLTFLEENTSIKRAMNTLKFIKDSTPGL